MNVCITLAEGAQLVARAAGRMVAGTKHSVLLTREAAERLRCSGAGSSALNHRTGSCF